MQDGPRRGNARSMALALVRWSIGLLFLAGGIGKITGLKGFVEFGIVTPFKDTFLPAWLLLAYGYTLPFVEAVLGLLLLLGLFRHVTLFVTGLTLISLAFGKMVVHDYATVASIFFYVFLCATLLYLHEDDRWGLGRG